MKEKQVPALKIVLRLAASWIVLGLLLYHAKLFFGPSLLTSVKAKVPLENMRPLVFFLLIALTILSAADGVRALFADRKGKRPLTAFRSPLSTILTIAVIFLNSILSFYEMELINNYYLLNMKWRYVFLGWGITFALYLIFVFVLNSLKIGMCAGNVFFLAWGIVNYFVQRFRGIPFQWIDFGSIGTGMSVSGNYKYTFTWQIVACIAVTVAVFGFYKHARTGRLFTSNPGRIASRAVAIALLLIFHLVIFRSDYLSSTGIWLRDWQPWYTYRLFGMEAGFFAFAKASYPEPPESYSAAEVERIIREAEEESAAASAGGNGANGAAAAGSDVIPDNILVIMNESFSDLRIYPEFETDVPLMPGIDALTEDTQKGTLLVSVKGGTTANTEYEFLTGNSCVLSPATVVYNSYIKQDQFSLVRTLKAQGYETIALHPYGSHGWNRDTVYPRMGFDSFLHKDNAFKDAEKVRDFVSDSADYKELIRLVETKEEGQKLFIFNITMQNHSAYKKDNFESTVDVKGFHGENEGQAEQYCSLLRLSDEAVTELLSYFRGHTEEKTMILFFGDHQPEIGDDFWEYCFGKDGDHLTFEEQQKEFETCFFLWANYDIPEAEGITMSANYLSSYLLSMTGLQSSGYNKYLLSMRESIPAMNAFGYVDTEGRCAAWGSEEADEKAEKKLEEYKCLIYNELTAGAARDKNFFEVKP